MLHYIDNFFLNYVIFEKENHEDRRFWYKFNAFFFLFLIPWMVLVVNKIIGEEKCGKMEKHKEGWSKRWWSMRYGSKKNCLKEK